MPSTLDGTAFVPFISGNLPDILCEQHERRVDNDNCVHFEGLSLQIPADEFRYHYVRTMVRVHRYVDATLALFHGPRRLAVYDARACPPSPRRCSGFSLEALGMNRAMAAKPLRATPFTALQPSHFNQ